MLHLSFIVTEKKAKKSHSVLFLHMLYKRTIPMLWTSFSEAQRGTAFRCIFTLKVVFCQKGKGGYSIAFFYGRHKCRPGYALYTCYLWTQTQSHPQNTNMEGLIHQASVTLSLIFHKHHSKSKERIMKYILILMTSF